MIKETVLCLDDEYELAYASQLCNELSINLEVVRWLSSVSAHVTRKQPSTLEGFKMETVFSGDEDKLGFFMHLLTKRMDSVNLLEECLKTGEEVQISKEPPSLNEDDDIFEMLYNEHKFSR